MLKQYVEIKRKSQIHTNIGFIADNNVLAYRTIGDSLRHITCRALRIKEA
jgi:hypothetical protein